MGKFSDYMQMRILIETYNRKLLFREVEGAGEDILEKIQAIIDRTEDENIKRFGRLARLIDRCPPEEYFNIVDASGSFDKEVAHVYQKAYWKIRLNYCINRMNNYKDRHFAGELVRVFRQLEERGLHLDDGHAISQTFMTASMSGAVISNQIKWYSEFLERNWNEIALPSYEERKAFSSFAWAYLALYSSDRSGAHEHVINFQNSVLYSRTSYANFAMRIGADKILSKIYFEKKETVALERQIRSIRGYVNRSPYPPHLQQQLLSFFDDLLDYSQNGQPLTTEQIEGWPLIDQVWGERVLAKGKPNA